MYASGVAVASTTTQANILCVWMTSGAVLLQLCSGSIQHHEHHFLPLLLAACCEEPLLRLERIYVRIGWSYPSELSILGCRFTGFMKMKTELLGHQTKKGRRNFVHHLIDQVPNWLQPTSSYCQHKIMMAQLKTSEIAVEPNFVSDYEWHSLVVIKSIQVYVHKMSTQLLPADSILPVLSMPSFLLFFSLLLFLFKHVHISLLLPLASSPFLFFFLYRVKLLGMVEPSVNSFKSYTALLHFQKSSTPNIFRISCSFSLMWATSSML